MSTLLKRSFWGLLALLVLVPLAGVWLMRDVALTNVSVLLNAATGRGIETPSQDVLQAQLRLPEGFSLQLYADHLPMVRMLAVTDAGDLLASRPRAGEVIWLRDSDGDGRADLRRVILSDLNRPHGIALWGEWLYVAETDAVGRVRFDSASGQVEGSFERLITGLPGGGNHWSRSIAFGPDGKLYVSVGSSCNACEEADPRRAALLRFDPDGSDAELFASGLRNTVGFDFAPWNGELYGTDNGRDLLGDDFPPCELNRIEQDGFYGWPYVNGFGVADPDLGGRGGDRVGLAQSPAHGFGAHTAPLGMRFLRNVDWPGFERTALVALHGSWNRSTPAGYKVVSLHWDASGAIEERDFLAGFETAGRIIGRPVDIVESRVTGSASDGNDTGEIYISDDYAGAIYRVQYGAPPAAQRSVSAPSPVDPAPAENSARVSGLEALEPLERARLITAGREEYQRWRCGSCHQGFRPLPLQGLQGRYDVESLAQFLQTPTPPMPAFPLDEPQRRALAVYLLASYP